MAFIQDYLATLFFIGSESALSELRRLLLKCFIKVWRSKATRLYLETVLLSKPFLLDDLIMLKLSLFGRESNAPKA